LFQRFGVDQITDQLLTQELTTSVNVGMGATDPDTRFQRFNQAMMVYTKLSVEGPAELDLPAVRTEVFGLAGFRDSARFFKPVDPRFVQAQKMLQQAKQIAEQEGAKIAEQLGQRERGLDKREDELAYKDLVLDIEKTATKMERGLVMEMRKRDTANG